MILEFWTVLIGGSKSLFYEIPNNFDTLISSVALMVAVVLSFVMVVMEHRTHMFR